MVKQGDIVKVRAYLKTRRAWQNVQKMPDLRKKSAGILAYGKDF